jgi:acyl-coenzyme A synthetase/AMP-(fatty) acid ligase
MANFKVPRAVEVVDHLPMTATGKVHKDELRQLAAQRHQRAAR